MIPLSVFSGVFAAIPTPVNRDGNADIRALNPLLDMLVRAGVDGICAGGATGEYPCFDVGERIEIFKHIGEYLAGRAPLICGVGSENWRQIPKMAEAAREAGATAVLLPPPSFFDYHSTDLKDLLRAAALECPLPVMLYHIPRFTKALQPADLIELVRSTENIVGIKDSSGDRETLIGLARAKQEQDFILMVGSDDLALAGLELKADGLISGLCSAAPGLVLSLHRAFSRGERPQAEELQETLQALINAISDLPSSWAIKIALEVQGLSMGVSSELAGPGLRNKMEKFRRWFDEWKMGIQQSRSF